MGKQPTRSWPVLRVRSKREGCARLSGCAVFSALAVLTSFLCAAWEVYFLNTLDRDWRDILYDIRINRRGQINNHIWFNSTLPNLVGLPERSAEVSRTVPVLQLRCRSSASDACKTLLSHTNAAMGHHPVNHSRKSSLVWASQAVVASRLHTDAELSALHAGTRLPEREAYGSSLSEQDVLAYVEGIKASHGPPRWVSPAAFELARVQGRSLGYSPVTTEGHDRWHWGLRDEDLSWFPRPCPDTAWRGTYYNAKAAVEFPAFQAGAVQDLPVQFAGHTKYVPYYRSSVDAAGAETTFRLSSVDVRVAMVLPTNSWRISRLDGAWASEVLDAAEAGTREVDVNFKDLSQPDAVQVPKYHGQQYIILSIAYGTIGIVGMILLAIGWVVVLYNVMAWEGRQAPWWADSTRRGW